MEDYRTIRGTAIGEYEEKKSRFIAQLSFADSEEKAVAFLEALQPGARVEVIAEQLRAEQERLDGPPVAAASSWLGE